MVIVTLEIVYFRVLHLIQIGHFIVVKDDIRRERIVDEWDGPTDKEEKRITFSSKVI